MIGLFVDGYDLWTNPNITTASSFSVDVGAAMDWAVGQDFLAGLMDKELYVVGGETPILIGPLIMAAGAGLAAYALTYTILHDVFGWSDTDSFRVAALVGIGVFAIVLYLLLF